MLRRSFAQHFWRVHQYSATVTVEAMGKAGILFTNKEARLRVTSSQVAHGEVLNASLEGLSHGEEEILQNAMKTRRIATVHAEHHLLSWPWNGDILETTFVTKVELPSS